MTKRLCHIGMTLALAVILGSHAWAASKEEIQLQVQLQNLLDQLTRIQKSMNEGVGLMNDLATRNADTVKKYDNPTRFGLPVLVVLDSDEHMVGLVTQTDLVRLLLRNDLDV